MVLQTCLSFSFWFYLSINKCPILMVSRTCQHILGSKTSPSPEDKDMPDSFNDPWIHWDYYTTWAEEPSFHYWYHLTNIAKKFLAFLFCSVLYFDNFSNLLWYDIVLQMNQIDSTLRDKNVWSISGPCSSIVLKEILTKLIGQPLLMLEFVVKLF